MLTPFRTRPRRAAAVPHRGPGPGALRPLRPPRGDPSAQITRSC